MEATNTISNETVSPTLVEKTTRSWKARLRLEFKANAAGTILFDREHEGPLRVQKPFFPEGKKVCHTYILHPPGGLVEGDALEIAINVNEGAHALLTTPAAGKVYRSSNGQAEQSVLAKVRSRGVLEWLPQETIVFCGARALLKTRIEMASTSRVMAWEIICLGRPAAAESFDRGTCILHFELRREGIPLFVERNTFDGGADTLSEAWGLGGFAATGTFVIHPSNPEALEIARTLCHDVEDSLCSATLVQDTLICRAFSRDATLVRERFVSVWNALRPASLERVGHNPRIWAT